MPEVSIIIPCLNEEKTISLLLMALCRQTYPLEKMEVVIADGMSVDGTRRVIEEFRQTHADLAIHLVDNPRRNIPSGLNIALQASAGKFIIRLDAHSIPSDHYIELCVRALNEGKGENVGGVWKIQPGADTPTARAIAAAAANPLGVGDALYRYSSQAGFVDTVPFGSFKREIFDKIGCFNEKLLTNEDYEFNTRLRLGGGKIWFDPSIQSIYFARTTLTSLAKQYWRYGFWKSQMLRKYPATIRWRQALPPVFVLSLVLLAVSGFFLPLSWLALAGGLILYFVLLSISAIPAARKQRDPLLILGVPTAIAVMHLCWGAGLLWGALQPKTKTVE